MKIKIKKIINYLFAEDEDLSLEHQLLLTSVILGTLTSVVGSVVNAILTTSLLAAIIPFILSFILFVVYYYIRVKKIIKPLVYPIIILGIISIGIIWLFNGGIDGSNILPAIVILILSLTMVSDKEKVVVLFFYLVVISSVYLIEWFSPHLIVRFPSREERWLDEFITIIYTAVLIFFIVKYLHKNYQKEKQKVVESERQLLKLNADKNKFISILGHDLRGPLSGILMFLGYFEKNIDKFDKQEIEGKVKLLNTSFTEVYNMLEDILKWGRAQMANFPFRPEYMQFEFICKRVIDHLKLSALNKNIELSYSESCKTQVWADKEILIIVLRNLLSNAIKFTPYGGTVKVSVISESEKHIICVEDSGIGIHPEKLVNLFDISQIQSTLGTEHEKGTGMGLLLCKEYVEKHNGKIWVESISGQGSRFKFTLPIQK